MLVLKHNAQQQKFQNQKQRWTKLTHHHSMHLLNSGVFQGSEIDICRHNFKKPGKHNSTNIVYKQCFECHVEKNTLHGVTQQQAQQKNLKKRGNHEQS